MCRLALLPETLLTGTAYQQGEALVLNTQSSSAWGSHSGCHHCQKLMIMHSCNAVLWNCQQTWKPNRKDVTITEVFEVWDTQTGLQPEWNIQWNGCLIVHELRERCISVAFFHSAYLLPRPRTADLQVARWNNQPPPPPWRKGPVHPLPYAHWRRICPSWDAWAALQLQSDVCKSSLPSTLATSGIRVPGLHIASFVYACQKQPVQCMGLASALELQL